MIAPARERSNESWSGRIIVESGADLSDAEVQAAFEINECFRTPNGLPQFLAGDDLTGLRDEAGENFGGLRLQV